MLERVLCLVMKAERKAADKVLLLKKTSLNAILKLHFGQVSAKINSAIESINNLEFLKNLTTKARWLKAVSPFETYRNSLFKPAPDLKPDNKVA